MRINHTGVQRKELLPKYGTKSIVYERLKAWKDSGILEAIFEEISKDCDILSYLAVKKHALADGLENSIRLIFTSGEAHDSKQGEPLLHGFNIEGAATSGDKAFGTVEIPTYTRKNGNTVITPPESNSATPWVVIATTTKDDTLLNDSSTS